MRYRIVSLLALCLAFQVHAQIPLTVTEIDYASTPVIDMAVGDLDGNGFDDIYLIAEGESRIIKLNNLGNGITFTAFTYQPLPAQPEALGTVSLNGGDDLYYVLSAQPGMNTLFGRDPWIAERTEGPVFFESVQGLREVSLLPFDYSQVLMATDTSGALHLAQIVQGSFNSVGILSVHRMLTGGVPGEIGGFTDGDTLDFYVPDVTHGQLKRTRIGHDILYNAIYEDELAVVDGGYVSPVSALTYADSTGVRIMFVLDTGAQTLSKLVFQGASFVKTPIGVSLSDMKRIGLGYIDDDPFVDLVIANGNELWLLSNAPQRSLQGEPELLAVYDQPVGFFYLADLNQDGIDDIISLPDDRTRVLIARNEVLSSIGEPALPAVGYWPNPARDVLHFDPALEVSEVILAGMDGKIRRLTADGGRVDISRVSPGIYTVSTRAGDRQFLDKLVIDPR